jgi:hypothetical protein
MKAVMMSVRFLTNAFGNILNVVVISLLKGAFSSQVGRPLMTSRPRKGKPRNYFLKKEL